MLSIAMKTEYNTALNYPHTHFIENSFGMAQGGKIDIIYEMNPSNLERSYSIILIISESQKRGWYSGVENGQTDTYTLCNQPSLYRKTIQNSGNISYSVKENDKYSVLFMQCRKNDRSDQTINIHLKMMNKQPSGDDYSYLPIQKVMMLRVTQGALILYSLLLIGLSGQFVFFGMWMRKIHILFGLTLLFKIIYMAVEYSEFSHRNVTGEISPPLLSLFYFISLFSDFASLSTFLLLAMGWTLVRQIMTDKEMQIIFGSLVSYLVAGMANAACSESDVCNFVFLLSYVLRCCVFLGIIVAINFTVTRLRSSIIQSPWVSSLSLQYCRAKQYHFLRLALLLYLILPTVFLIIQAKVFTWREEWIFLMLGEYLDVLMMLHVGVTFGPLIEANTLRAFDGTFDVMRPTAGAQ